MHMMLLATLVDAVNLWRWEYAVSNTPKGKRKPPRPEPIPRPGVKSRIKHWGRGAIRRSRFADWWATHKRNK